VFVINTEERRGSDFQHKFFAFLEISGLEHEASLKTYNSVDEDSIFHIASLVKM